LTERKMSYINDALKKAQQERDVRYERFGGLISSDSAGPGNLGKRGIPRSVAVTVRILVPAGLLLVVYLLWQQSPVAKRESPPLSPGSAAVGFLPEQAAKGSVSAGEALARPLLEETPLPLDAASAARTAGRKSAPGEAEARYREALSAQRKGDLPAAELLYEKVLALDPRHARALNNLGIVCMGLKKRERAIALLSKAIVVNREYVDPYYNLACLYGRTNEIDDSLWYLKVAMSINGDVKNWAEKDADLKSVVESPAFKKIMEGQKN
jgi:tetratricopeptide (TPR) repeat protein